MYVEGRSCPQCGRPLLKLGTAGPGMLVVPTPDRPSEHSRPRERVVSRSGYEAKTVREWVTECNALCTRCGIVLDSRDGTAGPPLPENTPSGYWLPDPATLPTVCQREGAGEHAGAAADAQASPRNMTLAESA